MPLLEISDLHVSVENKEILKRLSLTIGPGEIHALMGPNGSGKSTLAYVLMGHPKYKVTKGEISFLGENLLNLKPSERAKRGLFLAFQYPTAVSGVSVANLLRHSLKALGRDEEIKTFRKIAKEKMSELKIDDSFLSRSINDGFSGGEKKRFEVFQMGLLKPKLALLDEADSGLDIDALKTVANGINEYIKASQAGLIVITHYQRILNFIRPHVIHILAHGQIIASGGWEIVERLEKEGYDPFLKSEPQEANPHA